MTLQEALFVLTKVHTQDDSLTGFAIRMGAMPEPMLDGPHERYVTAWKVVREAAGLPTEPLHYVTKQRFDSTEFENEATQQLVKDSLFFAGSQWGQRTPEEILAALDSAGLMITRKPVITTVDDYAVRGTCETTSDTIHLDGR